ncbi:MAG: hypothetical protein IJH21_03130 [Oscillospiraceae bacterium]|nr:hypothetical protein [Oscillospiraceae bacterium]
MTPLKAIRAHCVDCCGGSWKEARLCPASSCPLYPYRMGHNPNRKRREPDSPEAEDLEEQEAE